MATAGNSRRAVGVGLLCCCLWTVTLAAVTTPNPTIIVKEGESAELQCSYSSDFTSPRVEWKFVNKDQETSFVFYDGSLTAPYKDRAIPYPQGITLKQITRKDAGEYSCEVTSTGSKTLYGEAKIQLQVIVAPSKPVAQVPRSVSTGSVAELLCVENDGYPPPTFIWYRNKSPMQIAPQNSTYTIDPKTGVLKFAAVSTSDSGEYYCEATNNQGKQASDLVRMDVQAVGDPLLLALAEDVNVGGIVAAVVIVLLILALIGFGMWFAYSRGYLDRKENKKVIYSLPSETRSDKNFQQTSSFLV